jgi:hypothetical protein
MQITGATGREYGLQPSERGPGYYGAEIDTAGRFLSDQLRKYIRAGAEDPIAESLRYYNAGDDPELRTRGEQYARKGRVLMERYGGGEGGVPQTGFAGIPGVGGGYGPEAWLARLFSWEPQVDVRIHMDPDFPGDVIAESDDEGVTVRQVQ